MKILVLLANRLKQYYIKNKLLFILFLAGGVLNMVMVLYSYGNLLDVVSNRDSQELGRREYSVVFGNTQPNLETVKTFAGNSLIEACAYIVEEGFRACDTDYPLTRLSGTLEFTEPYQVIVPPTAPESIGDTITLCGKEFEVIGSALDYYGGNYYIPYKTFVELGCGERITRIKFFSVERQKPSNDQVMALINRTFPERTHAGGGAESYAKDDIDQSEIMLTIICMNAFMAVLAYIFLLRHIVDSQMAENLVSVITGASRGEIVTYIFWETMLLSLGANGLGLFLHWALYKPVFIKLNIFENLRYEGSDYAFVYLMMLVLSLVVTIPFVMKYLKLSPVAARREHSM